MCFAECLIANIKGIPLHIPLHIQEQRSSRKSWKDLSNLQIFKIGMKKEQTLVHLIQAKEEGTNPDSHDYVNN